MRWGEGHFQNFKIDLLNITSVLKTETKTYDTALYKNHTHIIFVRTVASSAGKE